MVGVHGICDTQGAQIDEDLLQKVYDANGDWFVFPRTICGLMYVSETRTFRVWWDDKWVPDDNVTFQELMETADPGKKDEFACSMRHAMQNKDRRVTCIGARCGAPGSTLREYIISDSPDVVHQHPVAWCATNSFLNLQPWLATHGPFIVAAFELGDQAMSVGKYPHKIIVKWLEDHKHDFGLSEIRKLPRCTNHRQFVDFMIQRKEQGGLFLVWVDKGKHCIAVDAARGWVFDSHEGENFSKPFRLCHEVFDELCYTIQTARELVPKEAVADKSSVTAREKQQSTADDAPPPQLPQLVSMEPPRTEKFPTQTHLSTDTQLLVLCPGNSITNAQVDVVRRNASLIKSQMYSNRTTRNDGTGAFQVHFGKTTFAGSHVKKWYYILDGNALSRQELLDLTPSERQKIKRHGLFYDRKGSALLDGEVGRAFRNWLKHAADALYVSSPERYQNMMELTEPFVCDGRTVSLRLVDDIPFTNGTISYVEPSETSATALTTNGHYDTKDLKVGASVLESFAYPSNTSAQGGRLRVKLPNGTWKAVEVGQLAVGTLHNLFHEVEKVAGCQFRASFITQVYGPNIELRQALVNNPDVVPVDNEQKCEDVLAGLIPMTNHELDMANQSRRISDLFLKRGGLGTLKAAASLPVNTKNSKRKRK